MIRTNRLLVIFNTLLALILVLVLIQFAPSIANANSTTIVACANKKTGALRIAYKACSKKENYVSWGIVGPQGNSGPQGGTGQAGPSGLDKTGSAVIRDANGVSVNGVVQIFAETRTFYSLVNDGIWYFAMATGNPVLINNDSLIYKNSSCTGVYLLSSYLANPTVSDYYNLQLRVPGYQIGGGYKFYKLNSITPADATGYTHFIDEFGQCIAFAPDAMPLYGFTVTEVTPVPSFPAPMTLSAN